MGDLIEALQILKKYGDPHYPTHCEHDVLHVAIDPKMVSREDKVRLEQLSFSADEFGGFSSYRFGSC